MSFSYRITTLKAARRYCRMYEGTLEYTHMLYLGAKNTKATYLSGLGGVSFLKNIRDEFIAVIEDGVLYCPNTGYYIFK